MTRTQDQLRQRLKRFLMMNWTLDILDSPLNNSRRDLSSALGAITDSRHHTQFLDTAGEKDDLSTRIRNISAVKMKTASVRKLNRLFSLLRFFLIFIFCELIL